MVAGTETQATTHTPPNRRLLEGDRPIFRLLPVLLSIVTIVASGFLHGQWTDRWGTTHDVTDAAVRLDDVPITIGDWYSEELEIPARQIKAAEAVGHLSRVYRNRVDGSEVNVMILCGRPGPIAVHPPTVCFTGAGFGLDTEPEKFLVKAEDSSPLGEFWVGDFVKDSAAVRFRMRTFWSWNADDNWQVPNNTRVAFARYPYLYKMYVTRQLPSNEVPVSEDAAGDFLRLFIPELKRVLFQVQQ